MASVRPQGVIFHLVAMKTLREEKGATRINRPCNIPYSIPGIPRCTEQTYPTKTSK